METTAKDYKDRNICIVLDSQAAIKALDNFQINSKLLLGCHQSLVELAKHNRVQQVGYWDTWELTDMKYP
jgi:hypothetical protein